MHERAMSRSLFTHGRVRLIVRAIECGATQDEAADAAGIGLRTFALWLRRGRDHPASPYGELIRAIGQVMIERARARWAAIEAGDVQTAQTFITKKRKEMRRG